jgi:molybdenum cofactor synthesis domain-containing protein
VSDKGARGERVDTAGPAVAALVREAGNEVVDTAIVPDVRASIAARLRVWADSHAADVILTTGGTGLGPRDVTPEATLEVGERLVPGLAELMREEGRKSTHLSSLSRSVVVARGRTLIVNLPGSEKGAVESLQAIIELLPHAVELLQGDAQERHPVDRV